MELYLEEDEEDETGDSGRGPTPRPKEGVLGGHIWLSGPPPALAVRPKPRVSGSQAWGGIFAQTDKPCSFGAQIMAVTQTRRDVPPPPRNPAQLRSTGPQRTGRAPPSLMVEGRELPRPRWQEGAPEQALERQVAFCPQTLSRGEGAGKVNSGLPGHAPDCL